MTTDSARPDQRASVDSWLVTSDHLLADPTLVGHKFARQARMRAQAFTVPEFRCVSAAAFDAVVGPLEPLVPDDLDLAHLESIALDGWAAETRARVAVAPLPEGLTEEVLAAFAAVAGADEMVAVRACVVIGADGVGEDSATDPFAGLSDSFLYVRRDDVLQRVRQCWASAFNAEAVRYRLHRGTDPTTARVAVGIQRMVPGVRSFVAFTRDPRDGADRCVIAAAYGIGEGVVQEKADVDHTFVDRRTGTVRALTVHKVRAVGRNSAGGVGPIDVPAELADRPVLTDDEARQIADLAARVEELFTGPQDIEGTITADGAIHLVQARPAIIQSPATLAPQSVPTQASASPAPASVSRGLTPPVPTQESSASDDPGQQQIPWGNSNVTESFPGVSGALTFSVASQLYETGFADVYRRLGVPARVLRSNRLHLRRMIGYLDGRIYYRLDAWYTLHSQVRGFAALRATWENAIGLRWSGATGTAADPGRRGAARRGWRRVRAAADNVGTLVRLMRFPRSVRTFLDWWDGYFDGRAPSAGRPADELVSEYRALWQEVAARWGVTLVNGFFLLTVSARVNALMRRWVPGADGSLLTGMLCGGPENRSAAALRSAVRLAERVRADELLHEAINAGDDRALWTDIVDGRYGTELSTEMREHVRRFGDRGLHDLKMEAVTVRAQPWTLLSLIRPYVQQGLTVADTSQAEIVARREAELQLRTLCRNPARRAVLTTLMSAVRWFVQVREDTRFCRSQLLGVSREILIELGTQLARAGLLDDASEVLDLTVEEVLGAFEGTLPGADLRGLATVRRADRERWEKQAELPARLDTPAAVPLTIALAARGPGAPAPQTDGDGDVLIGLASSAGRVRARAKVLLDPHVPPESCHDRILVARETDPGWLFLMVAAKALVVERGTLLSHTAITGRILGVPTVVSVPGATTRIKDGSWIEVDGGAGTVRLCPDALPGEEPV